MKLTIKGENVKTSYEGNVSLEFELDFAELAQLEKLKMEARRLFAESLRIPAAPSIPPEPEPGKTEA